jgi:hypothetical protein
MITVTHEPLSAEKAAKVRRWLVSEERALLESVVQGVIAAHEVQAVNESMTEPHVIISEKCLSPSSNLRVIQAARYQIFLEVLEEFSKDETPMQTVKLSTYG